MGAGDFLNMRFLGLCGSLRALSVNRAALQAAGRVGHVEIFDGMGALPPFNPDLEREDAPELFPVAAVRLRAAVARADGLVICSPEYAHGISSVMKTALDWLVGGSQFSDKPIALINTAPRATHSHDQLREILTTMSGRVIEAASITLPVAGVGRFYDCEGIIADAALMDRLRSALSALAEATRR
jgi:NAD(P)H-dependent FMN reductase